MVLTILISLLAIVVCLIANHRRNKYYKQYTNRLDKLERRLDKLSSDEPIPPKTKLKKSYII